MRFAAIAVLAGLFGAAHAAAPNRFRVHPNSSLTILSIGQGPDGFLWLAAADGLYRFDGFHYQKIPDFPFVEARKIVSTRDGSLWIGSAEGLVRYKSSFEVVLRDSVLDLAALAEDVIAKLSLTDNALVHVDGSVRRFRQYARRDRTVDSTGHIWYISGTPRRVYQTDLHHLDNARETWIPVPGDYMDAAADGQGRVWAADDSRAMGVKDGRKVAEFHRRPYALAARAYPLLSGRDGQVWFLGETIRGTAPPRIFHDRREYESFDVTAAFEDPRGHLWAAIQGRGLVEWIPDDPWQRWFPEDLENHIPSQVVRSARGQLVAVTKTGLYRLDRRSREWIPLANSVEGAIALFPLSDGGFLASVQQLGMVRLSPSGRIVERLHNPESTDNYEEIQQDREGRLWVGHALALLRVEGRAGSYHLQESQLPLKTHPAVNPWDLEIASDGTLWVGYEKGIAWLDKADQWHQLPTDQPLQGVLSFLPPDPATGNIWAAQMGTNTWLGDTSSRFARLSREGARWTVHEFTAKNGYGPPGTRFLKRDSRGWIWRGASDGVYVSNGPDVAPGEWLHIAMANGLATEGTRPYGFFEEGDGGVWITGEQGITHIEPDPAWFEAPHRAPAPRISRIEADGKTFVDGKGTIEALRSRARLLRIEVGTLDAPAFRDAPLRYRLLPSEPAWQLSRNGTLEFQNLDAGAYRLEVAYAGAGSSPTLEFPFRVGVPSTRITWMWLLVIPAVLATMIVLRASALEKFRYRFHKAFFLLRRRLSGGSSSGPSGGAAGTYAAQPDYTGETLLERYRLLRAISRGGFSVVYEARGLAGGTTRTAVKIITVSAHDEGWVRDRFAYEVASLRSVHHPGVVPILDSWVSARGEPCLVMPFLDGPTLRAELTRRTFGAARAARIIRELGSVLSEVHARGIVHRDLKPENVILLAAGTEDERPVLIDFGMASLRGGENRMWNTTLLGGSFLYMAPERLTGHYAPASDVYSFGVMTLEMLSAVRLPDLDVMVSDDAFPDALGRALAHAVSPANLPRLVANLCRCYAAEPQRRPADVRAWAAEVAELLAPGCLLS